MKFLAGQCITALRHAGVFAWDLSRKRFVLSRASLCIAVFLLGSAPLSAGTQSVYVASGAGSFYDKPIQFKDHPSDTDYVCASVRAPGPYIAPGRPCDFVLWPDIPATLSIATCNTSDGICHNNNGGIETYVVKSSISGSTPTPPVVTPPTSGDGNATISWTIPTVDTDGKPIQKITGYNLYYGTSPANLATKNSLPPTPQSVTVSNLASGIYYFAMTTLAGGEESARTNLASKVVTSGVPIPTPPPVPPPIPTPSPTPSPPSTVTAIGGSWTAKQGASNLKSGFKTHEDCWAYLGTQPAGKYSCAFSGETVTVKTQ